MYRHLGKRLLVTAVLAAACATSLSACSITKLTSMSREPVSKHTQTTTSRTGSSSSSATGPSTTSTTAGTAADRADAAVVTSTSAAPAPTFAVGALTHTVSSGAHNLSIRYWTTDPSSSWHDGVPSTIQFSASLIDADAQHTVRVTRVLVTAAQPGAAATTLVDDSSQPILTPPYSYTNVLQVPASVTEAAQITVEFDLLIQSAPKSSDYYRQVYVDQLPLATGKGA
jgi:hypothetical protein